ncbi:hypothetical protein GQ44DRAFT_768177 [Phaeosphaeriaceae sp. PMI808]|nr:hypothetical protein GQ44DRAFT_768177 [Phaeosphaeriaceae sp. PMI808]
MSHPPPRLFVSKPVRGKRLTIITNLDSIITPPPVNTPTPLAKHRVPPTPHSIQSSPNSSLLSSTTSPPRPRYYHTALSQEDKTSLSRGVNNQNLATWSAADSRKHHDARKSLVPRGVDGACETEALRRIEHDSPRTHATPNTVRRFSKSFFPRSHDKKRTSERDVANRSQTEQSTCGLSSPGSGSSAPVIRPPSLRERRFSWNATPLEYTPSRTTSYFPPTHTPASHSHSHSHAHAHSRSTSANTLHSLTPARSSWSTGARTPPRRRVRSPLANELGTTRALADHSEVPSATLHVRAHGQRSIEEKAKEQQYLKDYEEVALLNFLLQLSNLGTTRSNQVYTRSSLLPYPSPNRVEETPKAAG